MDPVKKTYETSSEMSIEFEVDGPYKVRGICACAWVGAGCWEGAAQLPSCGRARFTCRPLRAHKRPPSSLKQPATARR